MNIFFYVDSKDIVFISKLDYFPVVR